MFAIRLVKLALTAAAIPVVALRAGLRAPVVASAHPRSREVRELLRDGFDLESVCVGHRGAPTVVALVKDGERRSVQDADVAFAVYALSRLQRRRLTGS
ncbi:MAG: hypothetical protein Q8L48_08390 [Archangium sp.]|nr:hypothetical protein [Archangium sp.]